MKAAEVPATALQAKGVPATALQMHGWTPGSHVEKTKLARDLVLGLASDSNLVMQMIPESLVPGLGPLIL